MSRLTIMLIIIAILCSGVVGFIFGAQNSQMIPSVNVLNNTTNDSSYAVDEPKYNYNSYKTNTTTKKTTQNTVPATNSKTDTNTNTDPKPTNKTT